MFARRSTVTTCCAFALLTWLVFVAPALAGTEHTVTVNTNNTFDPADLEIVEGDTVTWVNVGNGFHNVQRTGGGFRCANGCDGMGGNGDPSTADWSFSLTFGTIEFIDYECEVHVGIGMTGTLDVIANEVFTDGFESGGTSAWSLVVGSP